MKKNFKLFLFLLVLLPSHTACQTSKELYQNIDVASFYELLENRKNIYLLDVRTPEEFASGHLKNAQNINLQEEHFMEQVAKNISKNQTIAIYCRSGNRSERAAKLLAAKGYSCYNLLGGILEWTKQGRGVVKE